MVYSNFPDENDRQRRIVRRALAIYGWIVVVTLVVVVAIHAFAPFHFTDRTRTLFYPIEFILFLVVLITCITRSNV